MEKPQVFLMIQQSVLGNMYENGEGLKVDLSEAKKWYQMAANLGHGKARVELIRLGK